MSGKQIQKQIEHKPHRFKHQGNVKNPKTVTRTGADTAQQTLQVHTQSVSADLSPVLTNIDLINQIAALNRFQQLYGNIWTHHFLTNLQDLPPYPTGYTFSNSSSHSQTIQRETDDWELDLFPPALKGPLGPLNLTANLNQLQFGTGVMNLGYQFGGEIFGGMNLEDFSSRMGINPGSGAFSLGASYDGILDDDSLRLEANINSEGSGGVKLGYGLPMLPTSDDLDTTINRGGSAASDMLVDLMHNFDDPYSFYQSQHENINLTTDAVGMLTDIATQPTSTDEDFGVELQASYGPYRYDRTVDEFLIMARLRALIP